MNTRVVIYIRRGADALRQERVILKYCDEHHYIVESRCDQPQDCAQLIAAGLADLVVAVADAADGLRQLVRVAGGSVEFVRRSRRLPTVSDIIRRMARENRTPEEIARLIGSDTTDVRSALRRLDVRPHRKGSRPARQHERGAP